MSGDVNLSAGDVGAYPKGESDRRYQPRGNYQAAGNYQPAGNYALRGESYTKSETYSRNEIDSRIKPQNTANLSDNGWWICGDTGLIYQWGTVQFVESWGDKYVSFPKAFPNKCLSVQVSCNAVSQKPDQYVLYAKTFDQWTLTYWVRGIGNGVLYFFAVGY
ncbi:gp53-like domain-containing protein [Photorhabdus heterorhabditis]|uniref:gp53-like domain-containing protein n=1 Tax=Photorhabdus heterorhabditis TaxID=880156 RepID=UPI0020B67D18|nr:hypothetical protein [Photorhabdus heterorhabditis]